MTASSPTPPVLSGSPAFRDLGGLPAAGGRRVASGRLFRADALHSESLDPGGVLQSLGLRLVCDLRSGDERNLARCLHWLEPPPRHLHLEFSAGVAGKVTPLLRRMAASPDAGAALALMLTTYAELPRAAAPLLATLFAAIADGEWPVLVHCTAGKDRTGFAVAMILAALGVPESGIYADYLLGSRRTPLAAESPSARVFHGMLGRPHDAQEAAVLNGVPRDYLAASFDAIERGWGGVDDYLEHAVGLAAARRQALRDQLLA